MDRRLRRKLVEKDTREGRLNYKLLYFSCAIMSIPISSYADKVNAEWFSSARALGMGNAAIAASNDPITAMFYNPAALAKNKKMNAEFFNPQIEVGLGNFKLGGDGMSAFNHSALPKVDPELQRHPDTPSYYAASLYPNFHAQNFAFGILGKYETSAYRQRLTNDLRYRSRFMLVPSMGMSFGMMNGTIKFGLAPRVVMLTENDQLTRTYNGTTGYFTDAQEGTGIALDSGFLFTIPVSFLPSFGFVARNVGDTSFPGGASIAMGQGVTNKHQSVKMTMDAGFSLAPKIGKRSLVTLAFDYRDIENNSDTKAARKTNLGLEIDLSHFFFIRAGLRAGYWSAGLGLHGKLGKLDLGSYGEELDPHKFHEVQDRRLFFRYGGNF